MELSQLYHCFLNCTSVTTDSRNCPSGSLFIALRGASFDGNKFASKALKDGSAYAVVDDPTCVVEGDSRYILVDDTLKTLQALAAYHRVEMGIPILAITGTNGKTTTKELVATVLSQSYNVLYTEGNLNNHIGVPLTLLRINPCHQLAIIEMGANHPGEIAELAEIAQPNYGLITNIGKAHLEGFGSFEGVIKTKGELFDYLRGREDAKVFVNYNDELLKQMAHDLTCIYYGTNSDLYVSGHITGQSSCLSFSWRTAERSEYHKIYTHLVGSYNLPNAMAAVVIGHYFDVSDRNISQALADYEPRNNRSQLSKTDHNTLIIDAYNANPSSMMAALGNFKAMNESKKMVILGDMRELGADSEAEHAKIVEFVTDCNFDEVIFVGSEFTKVATTFNTFADASQLVTYLEQHRPEDYTILIKGSNGIKLSSIAQYL